MIRLVITNGLRFIVLVLFQVLVLNHIELHNTINPFLYVLFILLLPLNIPVWALLILAFALGIVVDMFSNTMGIHTAATVFMAYCRPFVLNTVTPRGGYEHEPVPGLKNMGVQWFITYSSVLVLLHHLILFNLEIFRLSEFFFTMLRVIASSVFTVVLILITQYFFTKGKER